MLSNEQFHILSLLSRTLTWFKQLNNFFSSCPWAFGLVFSTTAWTEVNWVLNYFPFSYAGAARGPPLSTVSPSLTKGSSSGVSPSWLRGCPRTRNPLRRGASLLPCSWWQETLNNFMPFFGTHKQFLLLLQLILDHVLPCLPLTP